MPLTELNKSNTVINKGKTNLISVFSKDKPLSVQLSTNKISIKFSNKLSKYSINDINYHRFKSNKLVSNKNEQKL